MKIVIKAFGEKEALANAKAVDARVLQAIETGLARGLLIAAGDAQKNFIQDGPRLKGEFGPGARLTSRSGALRKSINTKTNRTQNVVRGEIGSVLKYAAIHEFGFHGVMNVRAHVRATGQWTDDPNWGGEQIDTRRQWTDRDGNFLGFRDTRKQAARSQKKGFVTVQFVKAHTRRVDYAGKPYIRPALARTDIVGEINAELAKL
jgi:phage gpG-like protein